MKKITTIILVMLALQSYSQRIYDPFRYAALDENMVFAAVAPHKLGVGFMFASKPFMVERNVGLCGSVERGFYWNGSEWVVTKQVSIGVMVRPSNFDLYFCHNFNYGKMYGQHNKNTYMLGIGTKFNSLYLNICIDPILLEARIGVGFGF